MNYWDTLAEASRRLAAHDFVQAESLFHAAQAERAHSPGRVFLSEKLRDGLQRLWGGLHGGAGPEPAGGGRWDEASGLFRARFRQEGEVTVREAMRLSEFLPEGEGESSQAQLLAALHLLTRSQLFPAEPSAAAPLLKAIFRLALRAAQLFDVELLRADLPLTEEDRLWLARKGDDLLEAFFDVTDPAAASTVRREWAQALLQLLEPVYFAPHGRHPEERAWLEAQLSDRHLGNASASVARYRAYMAAYPGQAGRSDLARVRCLELLANLEAQSFPVPRYAEAAREAEAAVTDPAALRRRSAALRTMAWRHPLEEPSRAWATLAREADGSCLAILWWEDSPRDVAVWRPGTPGEPLRSFLAPCRERLIWTDDAAAGDLVAGGAAETSGWPVAPFVEALLEAQLPLEGLTEEAVRRIALSKLACWRGGWDRARGHPLLRPPRQGLEAESLGGSAVGRAVGTGLLWLAVLERLQDSDPTLRAGLLELADRGDPVAGLLISHLASRDGGAREVAGDREAWSLPPLAARPDPLARPGAVSRRTEGVDGPRPDLTGNRVAIVSTGRPAAVLAAWGAAAPHWRVVLDRPGHGEELAGSLGAAGSVTLLPRGDRPHAREAALDLLESLLAAGPSRPEADRGSWLALLHWTRLVECHNGDLLDLQAVRPRPRGALPLHDIYAELIADLPTVDPGAEGPEADPWCAEYRERARRSRLVVGPAAALTGDEAQLDALWGVRREGDAAWIFLDSCGVHWQLRELWGDDLAGLHSRLALRGRRHLSLLLGGQFLRESLEQLLADWLAPYGSAYGLSLSDARPALLQLAVGGVAPDALVLSLTAARDQLLHAADLCAEGESPLVLLPPQTGPAGWWRELAAGRLPWERGLPAPLCLEAVEFWQDRAGVRRDGRRLLVPVLSSLQPGDEVAPAGDDLAAWSTGDRQRRALLEQERGLLSLEINALLACGLAVVDVADPRWWRRFRLPDPGGGPPAAGDAESAAQLVEAAGGRPYDLGAGGEDGRLERRHRVEGERMPWLEGLRGWLRANGRLGPDDRGSPPGLPPLAATESAAPAGPGLRLHLGDGHAAWRACAGWLAEQRERGRQDRQLLILADRPPAGAASLIAAHPTEASTVVAGSERARGQVETATGIGPVLWIRPEDFARGGPPHGLAERHPPALFGGDLRGWLPTAAGSGAGGASILHWLGRSELEQADLYASSLPPAWESVLRHSWQESTGGRGRIVMASPEAAGPERDLSAGRVAVGRLPVRQEICPACGTPVSRRGWPRDCPRCGLDLAAWLPAAEEGGAVRLRLRHKLEALRERRDLGAGVPLQIWLQPSDFPVALAVLSDLGLEGRTRGSRCEIRPDAERIWHLGCTGPEPQSRGEERHALLFPPSQDAPWLVDPRLRERTTLWYRSDELVGDAGPAPADRVQRIFRLLGELEDWLPRRQEAPETAGRELIPLSYLEALSGLPSSILRADLRTLQWLAMMAGELALPEATGAVQAGSSWLHLDRPYLEIEHEIEQLDDAMDLLVPLMLASTSPGLVTLCDLMALPARLPEAVLARVDCLLLASSQRLAAPTELLPAEEPDTGEPELLYQPLAGLMASSRRRVGYLGSVADVTARLRHHLDLFLAAVKLLLTGAEREGEGWRVELAAESALVCDAQVLELGWLLGFWRWHGPAAEGGIDLAGLRRLAVTGTLRIPARAARLLTTLAAAEIVWTGDLRRALPLGLLEPAASAAARQAPPEPERAALRPEIAEAAERVQEVFQKRQPGLLVLRGPAGSGRLAAALEGLQRAGQAGLNLSAGTLYCPDVGTAARVHVAWRRSLPELQPPLALAGAELPAGGEGGGRLPGPAMADRWGLLIEVQRFATEERYRIAQHLRHGALLATLDPAEVVEPWEHLFLTTPRDEDVVDLTVQLRLARAPWREIRTLVPAAGFGRMKSRRRDKGSCRVQWAANLDECLACLEQERAAGGLADHLALTAPQPGDLEYLGRRLAASGWLPVYRQELDELLLPGPCEFLTLLAEVTGEAGPSSLLVGWLPVVARAAYQDWLPEGKLLAASSSLQDLYRAICRRSWAGPFLSAAWARRRVEHLLADVGEETPERFQRRPLWEAWRRARGLPSPAVEREGSTPLVTLARPGPQGRWSPAGVYLCQGVEPARDHYQVLSRLTDRILVLYQERSPLAGDLEREGT